MDLVGITEAAAILGVSRQRVDQLARARKDFPKPVATLSAGRIWTRRAVESFNQRWDRRRTGRPRLDRQHRGAA